MPPKREDQQFARLEPSTELSAVKVHALDGPPAEGSGASIAQDELPIEA